MLFNTPVFILVFLPITYAGFMAVGAGLGPRSARLWLLIASLLFFASWRPASLLILLASIAVNHAFGRRIRTGRSRVWLVIGLAFNLGLLAAFKYAGFFAALCGLPARSLALPPLGISFFTFQQVMFLVDTSRDGAAPAAFLDYACFIAFFPHVIAGPLVRPGRIIPQFAKLAPWRDWQPRLAAGVELFLLGLAKKTVLADSFSHFADPGFAAAARHDPISLIEAWVALLAYGLQIYFDFSGYSDMAIGLARMFGLHFPRNFHSPYKAASVGEFWKRWNITLSFFLRDYLYIPLGGNRQGEPRRIFNVMLTMLLGGLWHGAGWRFILWGGLHGLYLIVNGWWERLGRPVPRPLAHGVTLLVVLLAWVPFRAPDLAAAMVFYHGLFGLNGILVPEFLVELWPWLGHVGRAVPVLPYLGDARTLSLPQSVLLLAAGWFIALALPDVHSLTERGRTLALVSSFAFSVQAVFFLPYTIPFLYFQF